MELYFNSKDNPIKYMGERKKIKLLSSLDRIFFLEKFEYDIGVVPESETIVTTLFAPEGSAVFSVVETNGDDFSFWFEQIVKRTNFIRDFKYAKELKLYFDIENEIKILNEILYRPFIEAIARDLSKVNVLPVKCFEDYPQLQTEILARYRELKMEEILNLPAEEDCQPIYDKTEKELEAFGVVMQNVEKTLKTKRAMETLFEKK